MTPALAEPGLDAPALADGRADRRTDGADATNAPSVAPRPEGAGSGDGPGFRGPGAADDEGGAEWPGTAPAMATGETARGGLEKAAWGAPLLPGGRDGPGVTGGEGTSDERGGIAGHDRAFDIQHTSRQDGEDAHVALLVRHGLISHVAELSPPITTEGTRLFLAQAARVARNVIPLTSSRFGILLGSGGGEAAGAGLSDIPHMLCPAGGGDAGERESPSGADSAEAPGPEEAHPSRGAAPPPIAQATPVPGSASFGAPAGAMLPDLPGLIDAAVLAAVADALRDIAVPPEVAPPRAGSPATEALRPEPLPPAASAGGTSPDAALPGTTAASPASDIPSSDAPSPATPTPPPPPLAPDTEQALQFWIGMEEALRLLDATAGRLEQVASPAGSLPDDLTGLAASVAALEETMLEGLEVAGEARDADFRLLRDAVAPADGPTLRDRVAQLAEEQSRIVEGLGALVEHLARSAARQAQTFSALSERQERLETALATLIDVETGRAPQRPGLAETQPREPGPRAPT